MKRIIFGIFAVLLPCSGLCATLPPLQTEYQIRLEAKILKGSTFAKFAASLEQILQKEKAKLYYTDLQYETFEKISYTSSEPAFRKRISIRARHQINKQRWQLTVKYNALSLQEVLALNITPADNATTKLEQDIYSFKSKSALSSSIYLANEPKFSQLSEIKGYFPNLTFLHALPESTRIVGEKSTLLRIDNFYISDATSTLSATLDLWMPNNAAVAKADFGDALGGELSFKVKKNGLALHQFASHIFAALDAGIATL